MTHNYPTNHMNHTYRFLMLLCVTGSLLVACKSGSSEGGATDSTATESAATVNTAPATMPKVQDLEVKLKDWTIPTYSFSQIYASGGNIGSFVLNLSYTSESKAGSLQLSISDYESAGMASSSLAEYENADTAKAGLDESENSTIVAAKTITIAGQQVVVVHGDYGPQRATSGGKRVTMRRLIREGNRAVAVQVSIDVKDNDYASAEAHGVKVLEHMATVLGK